MKTEQFLITGDVVDWDDELRRAAAAAPPSLGNSTPAERLDVTFGSGSASKMEPTLVASHQPFAPVELNLAPVEAAGNLPIAKVAFDYQEPQPIALEIQSGSPAATLQVANLHSPVLTAGGQPQTSSMFFAAAGPSDLAPHSADPAVNLPATDITPAVTAATQPPEAQT